MSSTPTTDAPVGDATPLASVRASAPGRVNLIGEHTDYSGGLALPMAVDLGTTVTGRRTGPRTALRLVSADHDRPALLSVPIHDPAQVEPDWARYVAGVAQELHTTNGFDGEVRTTLPIGSGLSSSAALELAVALALGFEGSAMELAQLGQRAEQNASGVPCGLMDQLAVAASVAGHALRMDFSDGSVRSVEMPDEAAVVVVHSGQHRRLAGSAYADRRNESTRAAGLIGPLAEASPADARSIADPLLRRRARHVVSENERVDTFIDALAARDLGAAGEVLLASHASLRDDYEVSTPQLDELVDRLSATGGVHGARLTGAGFGGCVVALADPEALEGIGWHVRAAGGARLEILDD